MTDTDQWQLDDFDLSAEELSDCFDFDFNFDDKPKEQESRFVKAKLTKPGTVKWENAVQAAKQIEIKPGFCYFGILHGNFIFGDLLEALLVGKQIGVKRIDISTLSLSQDNIDSLKLLLEKGYIQELNLIVSAYFFAHERLDLIPYIYQELDFENRFQLAVVRTHTKIMTIETLKGFKIVIHGSANLRSSANIEQIMIQESEEIHNFVTEINNDILEHYQTIKKERNKILWQVVQKDRGAGVEAGEEKHRHKRGRNQQRNLYQPKICHSKNGH